MSDAAAASPGRREQRVRLLIQTALVAVVVAALTHTRADGDLWGHTLFGRDIVSARSIPSTDPYSFTTDVPWINHEWLAEVAMYVSSAALGGTGLIALKVATVLAALWLLALALRAQGVGPPVRDLLLALAAIASVQQANAVRPQIFSILLFAALLAVMVRVEQGRARMLWWLPTIFVVWVNVHGGWIVGAGTAGLWAAIRFVRSPREHSTRLALGVIAVSVLATIANPYGWEMWRFLLTTVRVNRAEIMDWQPIYVMGPGIYLTWAAMTALIGAAIWKSAERPALARAAIVAALVVGSFRVNRLLTFLALASAALLAPQFQQVFGRARRARTTSARPASLAIATVVALVVAISALGATATYGRCVMIEPERYPEAEVTAALIAAPPGERMLAWFNWGEYAIWHLSPRVKVSVDGRRETVYSPRVMQEHLMLYFTGRDVRAFLDEHQIDWIWLPVTLAAVPILKSQPDFTTLWDGRQSVVLARKTGSAAPRLSLATRDGPDLARCFPGP